MSGNTTENRAENTAEEAVRGESPEPRPKAVPGQGFVSEMFCSVQGEGLFVGERQIFLRTAGCAATCSWCDTVYSKVQTPRFVIHEESKRALPNPLHASKVVTEVIAFARSQGGVRTVSITGGEPLEQPAFVAAVASRLRARGYRIYLETAGLHAAALKEVLADVDVVAMDIKLPSATGSMAWDAHSAFLDAIRGTTFDPSAHDARTIFVKVVVDAHSTLEEIRKAAQIIAAVSPRIPLILQPESGTLLSQRVVREHAARALEVMRLGQRAALEVLDDVRIMPQCHKILGVR